MSKYHQKQIKALNLAIQALRRERRRLYAAGEAAYQQGIRKDVVNSQGVTGNLFVFAEDGHIQYMEYIQAIQELEDLKEILLDPGVKRDTVDLFEWKKLEA